MDVIVVLCECLCALTFVNSTQSIGSARVQKALKVLIAEHELCIAGRAAATKALELGLSKGDPRVQFAQLKGMADVLSLSLAQGGFRVSKYLPFGPVREVIPYLIRRAEENRGLLGNTVIDRQMIRSSVFLAYIV